eukprot:scaffold69795_cov58-Phaeocystis_antarctica.AAC.4
MPGSLGWARSGLMLLASAVEKIASPHTGGVCQLCIIKNTPRCRVAPGPARDDDRRGPLDGTRHHTRDTPRSRDSARRGRGGTLGANLTVGPNPCRRVQPTPSAPLGVFGSGVVHPWVGQIVTFFAYSPPSRPLGSLTPTQPGRVTDPTRGCPGPPWEAPQAECWLLRREPKPPAIRPSTGSCHRARSRSTTRPRQRPRPCMYPGGDWRHLLRTSPKRARPI